MLLLALIFGFAAWTWGALALARSQRAGPWARPAAFSGIACGAAMLCAVGQLLRWARWEDVTALLDCTGGIFFGAAVLVSVTALLLLGACVLERKKE